MESRVKLLGHPVHPMLVVFPVGLFVTSVIFDILYLIIRNQAFPTVSFYMIAAGIIGGLLAAIFGVIDWLGLPYNSRAWNLGVWHGIGNLLLMMLFILNWLQRRDNGNFIPESSGLFLSFAGIGLALVTSWIGGELVYRLGVAVDPHANINAPNSLKEDSPTPPKQ
jgi:uncharacterized membrane protein